jgi:hypothetical protein
MANDFDFQLTPVPYDPFKAEDQLDAWGKNTQRSAQALQPAAQPSSGDADPGHSRPVM